jgi:hypothetical protein
MFRISLRDSSELWDLRLTIRQSCGERCTGTKKSVASALPKMLQFIKWHYIIIDKMRAAIRDARESRRSAIAQAVRCRLPTAAARVQTRVWSCGICGGQSGAGARFRRVLRFPLPIYIPSDSPQSASLSPEAGTIGHEWPQCQ